MGRLPKIVISRKSTSLSIEMITSSDGMFANSGFLFYAISSSVYFNTVMAAEKNRINQQAKSNRRTSMKTTSSSSSNSNGHQDEEDELNRIETAMRRVEKWQVDACDSDMNECTIVVSDEPMYKSSSEKARVGYLFGINQYQPNGFTLKYVLRTKFFNTVAIYLEK